MKYIEEYVKTSEDFDLKMLIFKHKWFEKDLEQEKNKVIDVSAYKNCSGKQIVQAYADASEKKSETCDRLENELKLLTIYIQIIYEFRTEKIYKHFYDRYNDFIETIIFYIDNFDNIKNFISKFKPHFYEIMHILAVISFKYKDLADLLLNKIEFGYNKNFLAYLERYNQFGNFKDEIFLMISKLKNSELNTCLKDLDIKKTRKHNYVDLNDKYKKIYDLIFNFEDYGYEKNYLLNFCFGEDIDILGFLYNSFINKACEDKNLRNEKIKILNNIVKFDDKKDNSFMNRAIEIFSSDFLSFTNYIKYKFLNVKIILYCLGKLKSEVDKYDYDYEDILRGIENEFLSMEFLNKLVKLDERKFFYSLMKEICTRMINFSKYKNLSNDLIKNFIADTIKIINENSREIVELFIDYTKILDKKKRSENK
ncbi:hypothetical protein GVAV_002716 [Gurleya vavrai]